MTLKMRLFKAPPTPPPSARLRSLGTNAKVENHKRRTEGGEQIADNPSGEGGIDKRESYHFPQMDEGNGHKGKRKRKTGTAYGKTLGLKAE